MASKLSLYPFQSEAVEKIKHAPLHRWILSFEQGLGKTATSINALSVLGARRVLVICPALVRIGWHRELHNWWPESPEVGVISYGRGRTKGLSKKRLAEKEAALNAPFQITSYDLAGEIDSRNLDALIIDEIHKLKSPHTQQSRLVKSIARANPQAAIIGLTGTPMPDRPIDIWNPLDTLWAGRFGTDRNPDKIPWAFKDRYSNKTHNGHGWQFEGVNALHLPELCKRLSAVSTRMTKLEAAPWLPKLIVQPLYIDPKDLRKLRLTKTTSEGIEDALIRSGDEKIRPSVDWAETSLENGAKKLVIFTHLKETAYKIASALQPLGPAIFTITGEVPSDRRLEIIDQFQAVPRAICVATMHSAGIGINGLDIATEVLFAELYYRPETISQALGRFNRLSSKEPTTISLLVLRGTLDEAMVVQLQSKLAAINAAIKAGQAEARLEDSMLNSDDEQAFLESLKQYTSEDIDVP